MLEKSPSSDRDSRRDRREPARSRASRCARTPEPCALVIFGASGDLTQRKILPALYSLAFRRLLPERFAIVGVARTGDDDEEFRTAMEGGRPGARARDPFQQEVWDELAARHRTTSRPTSPTRRRGQARDDARQARRGAAARRQPRLLPRRPAAGVRDDRRGARQAARRPTAGRGSSSRSRSATTSRRRAAERELLRALHGGRDLPDRPLPRQGDRPEHARAAVRERDLRADLEPPVRRPRPDHGRRVDRDRGPRRLLRAGRRDPRHLPEPPAAAARADGDGAADRLHRRLGAQREGQGAARAAHARRRSRSSAASTGAASSRARRSRRTARRRASRPTR